MASSSAGRAMSPRRGSGFITRRISRASRPRLHDAAPPGLKHEFDFGSTCRMLVEGRGPEEAFRLFSSLVGNA
jgi:hypothetical protein